MKTLSVLLLLTALAAPPATAAPPRGRVLALTERPGEFRTRFARLASALDAWGFAVDERAVDDASLRVRHWDEWAYDKMVVVPGGKGEGIAIGHVLMGGEAPPAQIWPCRLPCSIPSIAWH